MLLLVDVVVRGLALGGLQLRPEDLNKDAGALATIAFSPPGAGIGEARLWHIGSQPIIHVSV